MLLWSTTINSGVRGLDRLIRDVHYGSPGVLLLV